MINKRCMLNIEQKEVINEWNARISKLSLDDNRDITIKLDNKLIRFEDASYDKRNMIKIRSQSLIKEYIKIKREVERREKITVDFDENQGYIVASVTKTSNVRDLNTGKKIEYNSSFNCGYVVLRISMIYYGSKITTIPINVKSLGVYDDFASLDVDKLTIEE